MNVENIDYSIGALREVANNTILQNWYNRVLTHEIAIIRQKGEIFAEREDSRGCIAFFFRKCGLCPVFLLNMMSTGMSTVKTRFLILASR